MKIFASSFLFRYIKIVTNKCYFKIDLANNLIIEDNKIKKFDNKNNQVDLLRKNILLFKNRINKKDYSLDDYNAALFDLDTCIKMHNSK